MRKPRTTQVTLGELVSGACSELACLGEELRSWYDSMPENLQGADKGNTLEESAGTLEGLDEPDVPGDSEGLSVTVQTRKATSRSARRDSACEGLRAAAEAVEEQIGELQTFHDDLESMADDAEGVEFPGMYG